MLTSLVATPKPKKFHRFALFTLVLSLFVAGAPSLAQATFTIFGPFPTITATYGMGSVPIVPPKTNSPAPWVFTSSNTKVATISGKTINIVGAGTSTITASQAAIGKYTSRSRSTQIHVSQGTPVIGAFAPESVSITQRTYILVPPTSTSDGYWSYISSDSNIASIVGNKVTIHAGGSVLIYATQTSTPNWKTASASMKFTVVAIAPVLGAFGDITIMKDSISSFNLKPPTSTSQAWWTFTSSNPSVASVVSNIVTPLAFGTTIITATQGAVGDYASATATMMLTVQGPIPTLSVFSDVTVQMSTSTSLAIQAPTSTSAGTWSFTSSDPTVASISGGIATFLKPGIVTITATQAPTLIFASPPSVSMKLTVVGPAQIGLWADIQKAIGDPDSALIPPTSTSSGSWTYTSSNPQIVDVVDGIVKVKAVGGVTISAIQNATSAFTQGSAHMTIFVFGARPTIGTFAPIVAKVGDAAILLKSPTSNSTGTWTYISSNTKVASINGSSLVILGIGSATITAIQGPAGIFSQSNAVQVQLTVNAMATPTPTPTVKPTPTPTPTAKPTPTVKPTPTPTPTANPTPPVKPTPTPAVNATIKVTAKGRVLTVVAIGVKALVFINGKPGKVGKNSVKPGIASIVITIDDKVVYRRVFSIK
jgi:hypothetical protein